MTERSLPGPVGKSCLTCKRRHKKCDQRRPTCARCERGDFECLGYIDHRIKVRSSPPRVTQPRPIAPAGGKLSQPIIRRSIATHERMVTESERDETDGASSTGSSVGVSSTPPSRYPSLSDVHPDLRTASKATNKSFTHSILLQHLFATFSRVPPLPPNQTTAFLSSPQFEDYILVNLDRVLNYAYFKPIRDQKNQFFAAIASRLRSSSTTRWVMLLDARICQGLVEDTLQPQLYADWIRDLEVVVRTTLARDPTSSDADTIQGDWLGLLVMKTALGSSSNAISLLRSAAPTFLQIAYSCPALWPDNCDSTSVPLVNVATSNRHELAVFALIDCTCAMVFGVPQQVDYETTTVPPPGSPLPYEWAHCSPIEFLVLLADINACRDKRPGARDWSEIEHQLVTWQPQPTQHNETWESWMVVAWLAVQESWRLTLLIYLYLAVCGASSDEPRVQLCVSQIFQVVSTVKKHDSPYVSIPFFFQYLMAGICALREKHRRIVRNKLLDKIETKFWKMQSADFVPVLDHLWHGAGSSGRPIKWCDYIHSREVIIPIAA